MYSLARTHSAHLCPAPHSVTSDWELDINHVGVFTPQKLKSVINQRFFFLPRGLVDTASSVVTLLEELLFWGRKRGEIGFGNTLIFKLGDVSIDVCLIVT